MSTRDNENRTTASPFYCYAVPIAPDKGAERAAHARLEELVHHSRWLVALRWGAAAFFAGLVTVARYALSLPVPAKTLYAAAACIAAYNLIFLAFGRRRRLGADVQAAIRTAERLATLQIVADLAALAFILNYSGGIENPFFSYFIFHVIIASILFSRRASFYLASLAVVLFYGIAIGQYFGFPRHHPLWPMGLNLHASAAYLVSVLFVFATTVYLAAYLAGNIVEKLRGRDRELLSLTASLETGSLELHEAYQRIKALEEKKSDVLRVASHQLRSPLSAIKSLLDVVVHGYAADTDKEHRLLERAHDRTDQLLVMINELLLLSRLKDIDHVRDESGERVDICSVLADLDALYRPKADRKGVRLELSPPPSLCVIVASGDDIREALNNLVDNAINYTPAGGTVRAAADLQGSKLVVTVSDTGIGIEPEETERIFEEFYRAPSAKRVNSHGTGLGLAIVKRAVEKWNGNMSVRSTPGKGTTFTLEFPVA